MADDPSAGKPKGLRARMVVASLLVIAAAVAFAAVFILFDGAQLLSDLWDSLFGPKPPQQVQPGPTPLPPGADLNLAKRIYIEQIDSGRNLALLAQGEFTEFAIDKVVNNGGAAKASITAKLKDGTSAPGEMGFIQRGGKWYIVIITGLREGDTGGSADVTAAKSTKAESIDVKLQKAAAEGSQTTGQVTSVDVSAAIAMDLKRAGIEAVDDGVLRTMVIEQAANQSLISGILDGSFNKIQLGAPVPGAGTVSIPATLTGPNGTSVKGSAVLLRKSIDSKERVFLTSFKKQ